MDVTIALDGVEKRVSVEPSGKGYVVTIEGRAHVVADVTALEGTLAFLVDRESFVAHVSSDAGGVRLSMRGRNYRLVEETMDTDHPGTDAAGGDGRIAAPMPGRVVGVRVAEGERVRAGTPVVVLESMKMQNEITAPVDGVVRRVHCRSGDQVGFGALLVEVAREGDA